MAEILHEILRKHGQTNKQTHRQTDMGITIPRPPPMGGEVMITRMTLDHSAAFFRPQSYITELCYFTFLQRLLSSCLCDAYMYMYMYMQMNCVSIQYIYIYIYMQEIIKHFLPKFTTTSYWPQLSNDHKGGLKYHKFVFS